jgi:hypothetical protein
MSLGMDDCCLAGRSQPAEISNVAIRRSALDDPMLKKVRHEKAQKAQDNDL